MSDPGPGDASAAAREGCAWEARWTRAAPSTETRLAACLERVGETGPSGAAALRPWRPGPGARPTDRGECLEHAHAGVVRHRACMTAAGFHERESGAVPYARPGAGPRETALAVRECSERSFQGSRYGPFTIDFEACLLRRGWQRPPPE